MKYTTEQFRKIHKYCYRMNKACDNKDINKVSDYFNHLKYHVMTGGVDIDELLNQLKVSTTQLQTLPVEIDKRLNNLKNDADNAVRYEKEAKEARETLSNSKNEIAEAKTLVSSNIQLLRDKTELNAKITALGIQISDLQKSKDEIESRSRDVDSIINYLNNLTDEKYMEELRNIAKIPSVKKGTDKLISLIEKIINDNKLEMERLSNLHSSVIKEKDSIIKERDDLILKKDDLIKSNKSELDSWALANSNNLKAIAENEIKISKLMESTKQQITEIASLKESVTSLQEKIETDNFKHNEEMEKLSNATKEYLELSKKVFQDAIKSANPRKNNP